MPKWYLIVAVLASVLWIGQGSATTRAQEPPDPAQTVAVITSPTTGGVISGQVQIFGSVSHPSAFAYYQLEYQNLDPLAAPIWLPITNPITQQAPSNEILGVWDTVDNGVSDGLYQIRLLVYLTDETLPPIEFIATSLQLINTAPPPLPTVETGVSPALPTAGPSPTSAIELPPTNTPRPTIEVLNSAQSSRATDSGDDGGTSINFGRLQTAFCTGGIITLIFFGILFAYLSVRARLRPITRQLMWQMRDINDER